MQQDFKVEDVLLTSPGCAFTDPEFNDQQHRVTYWDYSAPGNIKVFVGELDPTTGLFKKPPGRDHLVAEHVSPFFKDGKWWAHNGPEWGCDQNGWTVFFTKEDASGTRQLWRATPTVARYEVKQLTTLPGGACGGLYTQNAQEADTRLMFYVPDQDTVVWAAASAPSEIHELPGFRGFKSISHWVSGTRWVTYVRAASGSASPQLVYLDTETGAVHQVSDEPGDKFDAWGFHAPEFGGELLLMCVIDRRQIAVYRDLAKDGTPWKRNFGGCCAGPDMQPTRPNLAWIYKGVVGARERGTVKSSPLPPRVATVAFESTEHGFSFGYPGNLVKIENAKPLLLVQANNREAPTILADAVTASSVKEAVTQSFNKTFATRELEQYAERNAYFAPRQGVAGNIGGRVVTGKRFTFKYVPSPGQPPVSAVGVGWTKGGATPIIVVSYWGAYPEAMANYQLNKFLATLTIQ
jgi:hypothetical protein